MKHLLRALFLAVAVMLCTATFALPSAAEDFSGGFDPERFLVYEGLQARSKNDYAGLRSRYTVDDELVEDLVKEGHTVQYGAMMGVGTYLGQDYRQLSDLVVTYDKQSDKIGFGVKGAAIAIVYDSTGVNNPSGLYTARSEIKSSFAYTTTYRYGDMNATTLKDTEMVYRAFIIIDGNIEYVDAVGQTFGQTDATYGRTTSLYEVCDYFATKYETASGKPYETSVAIRNVISSCMSDSFTAEFADGLTLTGTMNDTNKVVFENAKAGIYAIKYKYIPTDKQGAFYAVYSAESGHTASAKIPFDASKTVTEPSWCPVTSYIYLAEGTNTLKFAGAGSTIKENGVNVTVPLPTPLYGVDLTLVEAMPVEDTAAITPKGSNTTVTKVNSNNDAGIKSYYGGNLVFLRGNDYATHSLTVNATGLYDIYFAYNCGGANVEVTANGVTAKSFATQPCVLNWNGTNSSMGNSSLSSSAAYLKVEDVPLNKGENTVTVKMAGGFITYGVMIAVRKTETVTLYDQDGETPISVQKVYDLADVVYPNNVKVPAGYDDVSGWSDLTYDEATGGYSSTVAYGKYYNVDFYDYDKTTLLASMKIAVGSDNAGPDMSGDKNFKGWSTPLSEVNSDCSVYAVKKQTNVSVSASDAILASASFTKVAADATYDAYRVYYSVTATETAFKAGEVYTKDGDTYSLAFTDTGATYYALTVKERKILAEGQVFAKIGSDYVPYLEEHLDAGETQYNLVVSTSDAKYDKDNKKTCYKKVDDQYVYLSSAEDGVSKYYALTVTALSVKDEEWFDPSADDYYVYNYSLAENSPVKTAGTYADRTYAPTTSTADAAMMIPNVGTMADYVTVRVYADYTGLYNLSFTGDTSKMVSWYGSVRNVTTTALNENIETYMTNRWVGYRISSGTKSVTKNAAYFLSKGETSAVTKGQLYLAEGWNEIRITQEGDGNSTTVLATTKVTFTLQTAIEDGGVVIEKYTSPAKKETHSYYEHNADAGYTRYKGGTYPQTVISNIDVTVNAGAYDIYFFGCDSGGTLEYIFTHKETGEEVSVPLATPSKNGGHSYNAHVENKVGSVTLPYDGDYTVTVNLTKNGNYVSFALIRLAPVTEDVTTHTVKFYDGNGNLLSVQSVADGMAATAPEVDTKKFLGWSADFSAVIEDMSVYAIYDVRFDVEYYDNEGSILFTESVQKGAAATPPDYTTYKEFKGWSLSPQEYIPVDFSSVTENMKLYAHYKKSTIELSVGDIKGSGMYVAVASDAVYSASTLYYTKEGDVYTPANITAFAEGVTYYTYNYTAEADSIFTLTSASYVPASAVNTDLIMLPNGGKVTLKVYAEKSGAYLLNLDYCKDRTYVWNFSVKNTTSSSVNANVKDFMKTDYFGGRIAGTKKTNEAYNFLFNTPKNESTFAMIYLAEGENTVVLSNPSHDKNSSFLSFSAARFVLLNEADTENDKNFFLGQYWKQHASYANAEFKETINTSTVSLTAGEYDLYATVIAAGTSRYAFTLSDGQKLTFTVGGKDMPSDGSVNTPEQIKTNKYANTGGRSTSAYMEVYVGRFSIAADGEYTLTAATEWRTNYIGYLGCRLHAATDTVTFVEPNGTVLSKQSVAIGTSATAPDMSGDAGFIRWDTDFSNITGDTTVTAVRRHTVTFRTHDGVLIAKKETVTGGTVVAPEAPDREYYYFTGWSKDFSSVTEDMSVRATYKEKERFTVTFVDRFGETLMTETVYTGDAVTPPAYTVPDGYLFLGWSDDTSAIFKNMTVTARTAATTLTGENLNGTGTTKVEAGEGTLETIFLPVDANGSEKPATYITFNVTADITGYYGLNLQMNNGGALLNYVRVKNTGVSTYEKNYYGVGRVNSGSSKASVTVDNCMVAEGTAYTNDILHVYLEKGPNTLQLSTNGGKSVGVSGITLTLKSGASLGGDYYAVYDKYEKSAGTGFIAAESDFSAVGSNMSGNDGQSGGIMLRTNRYVTLAETLTIREDGYYALHGVIAAGDAIVTLTDVRDPENVVIFNVANLGNKGGTASSPFWHGTRGTENIYAGEYKVKIYSKGTQVFTAYYLTREGELDGVYNVGTENATLGEGVERLENGVSVMLPGTASGYIEYSVLADRSGMFRVSLAASTAGAKLNGLYVSVNGGRIYTLSPAAFGIVGDGYMSTAFDDENCFYIPLNEGENKVRFYTANGEKASITGVRFYYEGALTDSEAYTGDSIVLSGTSGAATAVGSGTVTKNADHLYAASTANTNGAEIVYTFTVSSPRVVYFNMEAEAKLGTVLLYTLKDASGNTLRDTFYSVNHDTVGVETLNLDRFEFTAAGEYTLTLKVRRSPTNNKPGAGNEGAVIGSKVELKIYSVIFARTAESFATPDDKTGDITTSNVTGATMIGDGATVTFRNVSLHENATYALRILGRVSGGTVVKITYTGAGNILESDYFYDMLFTVTEVSEIPAGNTTVYEYNTRTGRYDLATAYNADTVYYLKTGEVTASSGTVTFTATENITATQWLTIGNLNLLADTYTITVTVEDGSFVVDDMVLVRTADYLRTIELDRSAISTTDANEVRTAILSDNHYVHGELGGIGDLDRQNLMLDMLLSEYNTAESLDAAFLAGDLGNFRLNATNTIENGQIYYYSATYLVENVLRRLTENGLPYFATHSGHDYMSSETWYDLFGYEKNYVVVIEDAAFICLDYYYDQADCFAHEPKEAQTDISDEVYESILAVLNRDDITHASMVIHYSPSSSSTLPNVNKLTSHPKLNVVFGGHTHDNTTQLSVGSNVQSAGGAVFLQHSHFSIVSGYDTGGKTIIDPIINLTNEGYYQVFSNVSVGTKVYATTSEIGLEYANSHETTKLASGNYSKSGRWQTAAYTVDGKKIIFFRDDLLVPKKQYEALSYNYYVIDGDNVYPVDLTNAVSETYQFTYTGAEDTDKSVNGLVYGVDYYKVGMANGFDVVVFPDSFNTTKGNYNLTTTGKTYYLVNGDGRLMLLSGVTVAPHAVAEANHVIEELNTYNGKTIRGYEVSGNPWGLRILERVNGTETDIVESYFVYGGYTFNNTYIGYMRVRPRDMAGYIDHLYVVVDTIEKN